MSHQASKRPDRSFALHGTVFHWIKLGGRLVGQAVALS